MPLILIILILFMIFIYLIVRNIKKGEKLSEIEKENIELKDYKEKNENSLKRNDFEKKKDFVLELINKKLHSENIKNQIKLAIIDLEQIYKENLDYSKKNTSFKISFKLRRERKRILKEMDTLSNKLLQTESKEISLKEANRYVDIITKAREKISS